MAQQDVKLSIRRLASHSNRRYLEEDVNMRGAFHRSVRQPCTRAQDGLGFRSEGAKPEVLYVDSLEPVMNFA